MANKVLKGLVSYLIIISIFVSGVGLAEVGFVLYWSHILYLFFALISILLIGKINKTLLIVLSCSFLILTLVNQSSILPLFKQIVNISFSAYVFFSFIIYENSNLEAIFYKYIAVGKLILILGFIQVGLYMIHKEQLFLFLFPFLKETNISYRLQSITLEPSFYAYTFTPIAFVSLYNLFSNSSLYFGKKWSLLFIAGYLMTISSIAYLGFIVMIVFIYFRNLTKLKIVFSFLIVLAIISIASAAYNYLEDVKIRVDDTYDGIVNGIIDNGKFRQVNLSTYALLANAYVTRKSLENHLLIGNGLGTHEISFYKYLPSDAIQYSDLQSKDAASLALRLLSETGIIGFCLFLFFLKMNRIKWFDKFSLDEQRLWVINSGIFFMILLFLLRSGDYTFHGRILFILIFYLSHKQIKTLAKNRFEN
jgi:hypothetical protein